MTPLDQKLLKRHGNFDVYTIANNPRLLSMFTQFELPNFSSTSDGIYFEPIAKVINGTQSYFIKWFCLRDDFSMSADHSYDYARIFTNGYLMKILIPRAFNTKNEQEEVTDFNILYVTPCSQFNVTEVSGRTFSGDETEEDPLNGVNDIYKITPFDPDMYPEIIPLIQNRESFINNYLQDVVRMIERG